MEYSPKYEQAKRLEPTKNVLRKLFLKSGNVCAFPGCHAIMMNENGDFIGQICHIEGVRGERFQPGMSNEERRAYDNLLLLCYQHHVETNDERVWTVERMARMKRDHEARFTDPGTIMLEAFVDRTRGSTVHGVANLGRMARVLGWQHEPFELADAVAELNGFIGRFALVPLETRRFLGAVIERTWCMRDSGAARYNRGEMALNFDDMRAAHRLSLSKIRGHVDQLEAYRLGGWRELNFASDGEDAIGINSLHSGWPFWGDLVQFCELAREPLIVFIERLEFARLDD